MTLPPTEAERNRPATQDERDMALWPLFSQFATGESDPEGKRVGYHIALEGKPLWAIERAVRRFLADEVSGFDRRWLPNSAQLVNVVREEIDHARRMAELSAAPAPVPRLTRPASRRYSEAEREAVLRKLKAPGSGVGSAVLTRTEMRRLPVGTVCDAMGRLQYPDGRVETVEEFRARDAAS